MGARKGRTTRTDACRARTVAVLLGLVPLTGLGVLVPAAPAAADSGQCTMPAKTYKGRPWALQRVLLDELWKETKGAGVKVAVIDTGVDNKHPQLKDAVDTKLGKNVLSKVPKKDADGESLPRGKENGTSDPVGHGTKVAGIIAARPDARTGFVGIAPAATIIPIRQNDGQGGGNVGSMAQSIDLAVKAGADVINISQDTDEPLNADSSLELAVERALAKEIVVVASAGNDGLDGNVKTTYPASYEGVLAVASSDRNNERAVFSQSGEFVDIAAPGVDMVSTMPGGGHCSDNGTSFSAPYVAGVAALLRAQHDGWTAREIVAQIEQTAERSIGEHDRHVGWGIVDPVRALTEDDQPVQEPEAREGVTQAEKPTPAKLELGETTQERNERLGTYAVVGGGVLVAVIGGGSRVHRDWRRRTVRE
ncbi:type VII secretion-associated serine protease mycosin [Streptomyces sp. Z26]|uniref:type VII secretion-associated serine protease mycosin n=1 Tax=Streptomyces sp. Z26 TaxID=2500177 RepID=UPI000EF14708|nr:type VII secretion-associated serine protease mycosin [Streptomyces sp. Z26]RLL69151.1 type VII secretion-associated serine protease mycosin [Streptomyces sp. Z26]